MNLQTIASPNGLGLNVKANLAIEPPNFDFSVPSIAGIGNIFDISRTHSKKCHKKTKSVKHVEEDPEISLHPSKIEDSKKKPNTSKNIKEKKPNDSKNSKGGKTDEKSESKNVNINNISINIGETLAKLLKIPEK